MATSSDAPRPRGPIVIPERSKVVKTTINLPEEAMNTAKYLAAVDQTTVGQVFRRALELSKFVHDLTARGARVLIEEPDGTIQHIVILP